METTEDRIQAALANPQNMGEMTDADAVGTVGNPECGDMVEGALREALKADSGEAPTPAPTEPSSVGGETLLGSFQAQPLKSGKLKVVKLD